MLAASPGTAAVLRNAVRSLNHTLSQLVTGRILQLVGVEQNMVQDPFEQDDLVAPLGGEMAGVPASLAKLPSKVRPSDLVGKAG